MYTVVRGGTRQYVHLARGRAQRGGIRLACGNATTSQDYWQTPHPASEVTCPRCTVYVRTLDKDHDAE